MSDLGAYGRWQVVKRLAPDKRRAGDHGVRARMLVRCRCGAERIAWREDLTAGLTRGCRSVRCQVRCEVVDAVKREFDRARKRDPRKDTALADMASRLDEWIAEERRRELADRLERRTGLEELASAVTDGE